MPGPLNPDLIGSRFKETGPRSAFCSLGTDPEPQMASFLPPEWPLESAGHSKFPPVTHTQRRVLKHQVTGKRRIPESIKWFLDRAKCSEASLLPLPRLPFPGVELPGPANLRAAGQELDSARVQAARRSCHLSKLCSFLPPPSCRKLGLTPAQRKDGLSCSLQKEGPQIPQPSSGSGKPQKGHRWLSAPAKEGGEAVITLTAAATGIHPPRRFGKPGQVLMAKQIRGFSWQLAEIA